MDSGHYFIHPDHSQASTLDAQTYTDPLSLTLEQDRVFKQTWQFAASLEHLRQPGNFLAVEVAGIPIVLTRDGDGQLHAFYNICRHRAGVVARGFGNRRSLQCAYHGWLYSLDGQLKNAPEIEGTADFQADDFGLLPIRVDTWGPLVFVNLSGDAPPLLEVLGKIPEETAPFQFGPMRMIKRVDYPVASNWKTYVDNYLEGYHVPIAHPGLYKEIDYAQYRVDTFRYYSSQYAPIRPVRAEDASGRVYTQLTGDDKALYYWLFPNFMINIYMGLLQINIVLPVSVDQTIVRFEWYFADDASPQSWDKLNDAIEFSDEIQREDAQLCADVHRNMKTGIYRQGRFNARRENGVHHFQRLLSEFIGRGA